MYVLKKGERQPLLTRERGLLQEGQEHCVVLAKKLGKSDELTIWRLFKPEKYISRSREPRPAQKL